MWSPPAHVVERLRTALTDDWELIDVEAPVTGRGDGGGLSEEAVRAIRGAEIYFGLGLPHALLLAGLEGASNLRWIHSGAAGVASLLHPELTESDVLLTNSAGIHAPPMAETVIGMMLYFARGFDHALRAQSAATWDSTPFERTDSGVRELSGATLGILGYGGIGRAVAERARALGMSVVAAKRRPATDYAVEILSGHDALERLLERSDVVVLSLPSTPMTRGMIGARELAGMKPGAVLINVARGDIIDETALIDALSRGTLRGAGLDVFTREPLPSDSPLWRLPNVLITPHVSATSAKFWERESELMLDNVERYLGGRPLRNVVDTSAGY